MNQKMKILIAVIVTAVIVGGGVYFVSTNEEVATDADPEFRSLFSEKENNDLPYGAAEIEGYYTTVKRATSLDGSTPEIKCSAFVVTNGPTSLLEFLKGERFGTPPTVVIGSKDSNWGSINKSTKDDPIKVLVTTNPEFEGEVVGCMSWPFDSITEL